jgi:sulfate permease, SulP family
MSNMLTGLLGAGFTGSYIFSQTVFTQRSGCENRLIGYVIVVAEMLLFLVPMSFVQYLPNFYYGALMLVFGLEIGLDWLVYSYSKFTRSEYVLTLTVFVIIMAAVERWEVSGLEIGIAIGVLICTVHFTVEYGKVQVRRLTISGSTSSCVRPRAQSDVLNIFKHHLCVLSLANALSGPFFP